MVLVLWQATHYQLPISIFVVNSLAARLSISDRHSLLAFQDGGRSRSRQR